MIVPQALVVFCRERKAQGQRYHNRHSKPEFTQCRERVFALIQRGRDVRGLASERRLLKRRYLHQRQVRSDAGDIVSVNSAMASELSDAKRRFPNLAEELAGTKSAAPMLKDDGILY